jgi:hypothetical protein
MKTINFSLTVEETNKILEALAQLPFVQVNQLISKIHTDANAQLRGSTEPESETENVKSLAHG